MLKKSFSSNDICSLVPELNDDATAGGLWKKSGPMSLGGKL